MTSELFIQAYVYKITHTISGKYYYGYRYANQKSNIAPELDLWIKYFTSSKHIKELIENDGIDSFTHDIIFKHEDALVCWTYEQLMIKEHWGDEKLLNGKYHDPCSNIEHIRRIGFISEKSRQRMRDGQKGRIYTIERNNKISNSLIGKPQTDEKREKISKYATNKVNVIDNLDGKKKKISKQEFDENPNRYSGQTKGIVSAYDLILNKFCTISAEEFKRERNIRYVGVNSSKIPK